MGSVRSPLPVLLFVAVSSGEEEAFNWFESRANEQWGDVLTISPMLPFNQTEYYSKSMGSPLLKRFYVFKNPMDPAGIAQIKLLSNQWESEYRAVTGLQVERPINIDPGYVTEAKLVLATTKDRDHRVYLDQGIYAEITLYYQNHQWQHSRWTYPDYRLEETFATLTTARDYLRSIIHPTAN